MRSLYLSIAALAAFSSPAMAHPEHSEAPKPVPDAAFPSKADLEKAIDDMPDINAILGDLIVIVSQSDLPRQMERTGETLKKDLKDSGALEPDRNGLPDIKLTLKTVMNAFMDEGVSESLLETGKEMQAVIEKHAPAQAETKKAPD